MFLDLGQHRTQALGVIGHPALQPLGVGLVLDAQQHLAALARAKADKPIALVAREPLAQADAGDRADTADLLHREALLAEQNVVAALPESGLNARLVGLGQFATLIVSQLDVSFFAFHKAKIIVKNIILSHYLEPTFVFHVPTTRVWKIR